MSKLLSSSELSVAIYDIGRSADQFPLMRDALEKIRAHVGAAADEIARLTFLLERIDTAEKHLKHYAYGRSADEQIGEVARNVLRDYRAAQAKRTSQAAPE